MRPITERQLEEIEGLYYDYWHKYPAKGVYDFWDWRELKKLLKELKIEKCDELLDYLEEVL